MPPIGGSPADASSPLARRRSPQQSPLSQGGPGGDLAACSSRVDGPDAVLLGGVLLPELGPRRLDALRGDRGVEVPVLRALEDAGLVGLHRLLLSAAGGVRCVHEQKNRDISIPRQAASEEIDRRGVSPLPFRRGQGAVIRRHRPPAQDHAAPFARVVAAPVCGRLVEGKRPMPVLVAQHPDLERFGLRFVAHRPPARESAAMA